MEMGLRLAGEQSWRRWVLRPCIFQAFDSRHEALNLDLRFAHARSLASFIKVAASAFPPLLQEFQGAGRECFSFAKARVLAIMRTHRSRGAFSREEIASVVRYQIEDLALLQYHYCTPLLRRQSSKAFSKSCPSFSHRSPISPHVRFLTIVSTIRSFRMSIASASVLASRGKYCALYGSSLSFTILSLALVSSTSLST